MKNQSFFSPHINLPFPSRVRKEKGLARSSDPPLGETFQSAYDKCLKLIESNTPVQTHEDFSMGEVDIIRDFGLITTKPQIYVINMSKVSIFSFGFVVRRSSRRIR
jgi:hypothetical protein